LHVGQSDAISSSAGGEATTVPTESEPPADVVYQAPTVHETSQPFPFPATNIVPNVTKDFAGDGHLAAPRRVIVESVTVLA
jgi:hypothetical protein